MEHDKESNEILFSNLSSNLSEKKNDIKPNTGNINVNATLKPSLIFEWDKKCNKKAFVIINTSAVNQLKVWYDVNINPIKELIKTTTAPIIMYIFFIFFFFKLLEAEEALS